MRVLCLGLDGADYDLVRELLAEGPAADAGAPGARGRLRAASLDDSGRHADGVVVVPDRSQPGRARDLQLLDQPEPRPAARRERRQPRRRAALAARSAAAGIRSAFVGDAVHVSGRADRRHRRHGLRRARSSRRSSPTPPRERILAAYPELVTAHHPMAERWWEDFDALRRAGSSSTSTRPRTSAGSPSSSSPTSSSSASTS